ncbi:uncharacterized protein [Apostichopus japonicus]|uniref:uncharacterized protein n=1 Tax=Stichopus japonicus TaxID=307972 RepID=UPI003AB4876B
MVFHNGVRSLFLKSDANDYCQRLQQVYLYLQKYPECSNLGFPSTLQDTLPKTMTKAVHGDGTFPMSSPIASDESDNDLDYMKSMTVAIVKSLSSLMKVHGMVDSPSNSEPEDYSTGDNALYRRLLLVGRHTPRDHVNRTTTFIKRVDVPTYGRRRRISLGVDWSSVAAMTAVAHAPNSQNDKSYFFFFNGRARAAHYLHGWFML